MAKVESEVLKNREPLYSLSIKLSEKIIKQTVQEFEILS
jgi:hypothetical protein